MSIKIAVGSDHAGFELKGELMKVLKDTYWVVDKGCYSVERSDYSDYGHLVATAVTSKEVDVGILMCGSGNGINMTANKHKGIRAALCWNREVTALARQHNNANVLVLPARYMSLEDAKECVEIFLSQEFEGGRHLQRVNKIDI